MTWRNVMFCTVIKGYVIRLDVTFDSMCCDEICRNEIDKLLCDNISSSRNCSTGLGESDKTP